MCLRLETKTLCACGILSGINFFDLRGKFGIPENNWKCDLEDSLRILLYPAWWMALERQFFLYRNDSKLILIEILWIFCYFYIFYFSFLIDFYWTLNDLLRKVAVGVKVTGAEFIALILKCFFFWYHLHLANSRSDSYLGLFMHSVTNTWLKKIKAICHSVKAGGHPHSSFVLP